jgi:hypothetical protein
MEIEYFLTLEDLEAFARFQLKQGPKLKPLPLVRGITWVLAIALVSLGFLSRGFFVRPEYRWVSGLCAGLAAGIVLVVLLMAWLARKTVVRNALRVYEADEGQWYLAPRRLKITATGFETVNEYMQFRSSWSTVWQIKSTADHAFFYINLHQAHVIPRHAFRDERQFEDFIELARRYHQGRESTHDEILDALPARPTGITRRPPS